MGNEPGGISRRSEQKAGIGLILGELAAKQDDSDDDDPSNKNDI